MISIEDITRAVAQSYGTTPEHLRGKDRRQLAVSARGVAYSLARELTDMSLPDIGRFFGRDHTTVLNGINRADHDMIDAIRECVTEKPIFKSVRAK